MTRLLQSLRRVLGLNTSKPALPKFSRSLDTNFSLFREGDRVIVHGKNPILSKPLRQGHKTDTRRGTLYHDIIIGRRARDLYQAHKGPEYRLSLPNFDEYVAMTPRLVTPIYAADASLIVSLLDIHVAPPAEGEQAPPLEILESGTGHGSLTLHLARAIQAANSNPPPLPEKSQIQYLSDRPHRPGEEDAPRTAAQKEQQSGANTADDPTQKQWDTWRGHRGAIIHTVDVSPKFSVHAEKIVRGFRRGIYAGSVDFYVGHVEKWIAEQIKIRASASASTGLLSSLTNRGNTHPDPFLSHAILDMPSAQMRIPHVAPILKRDGFLVVFMPSITQIGECIELIRRQRLPFVQEKIVELGAGISGGRQWDVRFAVKKSRADPSSWTESSSSTDSEEGAAQQDQESQPVVEGEGESPKEDDSVLVCRPKVGTRIVGGGFVGIWRRIEDSVRK